MVDIIIPIYNAVDDLELCLESVKKYTDLKQNRLILINDNSTDYRVQEVLSRQVGKNIIVIHNNKNRGFAENINIGMKQSNENDVILLNSDTMVTEKWVEKMIACAYIEKNIGMVSPLSNNATICSVPVMGVENELPEGLNIDEVGYIVEKCSLQKYPIIPVCHGFCMLIKREVIRAVGGFDSETFGRGYGEENDFCFRAGKKGFYSVLCDDTFVFHSGTKSFMSEEKKKNNAEHELILKKRYPSNMYKISEYLTEMPNDDICENINIYFDICKQNTVVLNKGDERANKEFKNNICEMFHKGKKLYISIATQKSKYYWKLDVQNTDFIHEMIKTLNRISNKDYEIDTHIEFKYLFNSYRKRACALDEYRGYKHDSLIYDGKMNALTYVYLCTKFFANKGIIPIKNSLWLLKKRLSL